MLPFCFLLSGAAALVYQVAWLRALELVFGGTSYAAATVLATFMAGLAVGSYLGGRLAGPRARLLQAYGSLEVAIGGYALLAPHLLGLLPPLYRFASGLQESSPLGFALARFLLASAVLLPPTILMGATLPVASEYCGRLGSRLVGRIGTLYGLNTLGAVVGAGLAGLVLLPRFGYSGTIRLAVATNVLAGAIAVLLSRRHEVLPGPPGAARQDRGPSRFPLAPREATVMAALGLTGFAALMLEVGWTRTLALILGPSTYAFSVMLATLLAGLALGSLLVSWAIERWAWKGSEIFWMLAAGCGVLVVVTLSVAGRLPYLFAVLFYRWRAHAAPAALFALEGLVAALVLLLPALLMGGLFPAGLAAAGLRGEGAGRSVGRLYAANTLGAVLGAVATGFFLIPSLGIAATIRTAALGYFAVAAGLAIMSARGPRLRGLTRGGAILVAALAVSAAAPRWDPMVMTAGIFDTVTRLPGRGFTADDFRRATSQDYTLLYYREGAVSTVSVIENPTRRAVLGGQEVPYRAYLTDGKADASSGGDMATQIMLGHVALFLHPAPRRALVIGLASGTTAGSVLTHPVDSLDVVEIEPAAVPASRLFDMVNGRPLDDPRTRLVVADARSYLLAAPTRYDVIVSEPSNPWMAGPANLFTREFFEIARGRLEPGGLFCQWLQIYRLSEQRFRTILATFQSVFPHAYLFQPPWHNDAIVVGSVRPVGIDAARIGLRLATPAVQADLERVGLGGLLSILAQARAGPEHVRRLSRGAPVNTDDNGLVLFGAPLDLYRRRTTAENQRLLRSVARGIASEVRLPGAPPELETDFLLKLANAYRRFGFVREARATQDEAARRLAERRAAATNPR